MQAFTSGHSVFPSTQAREAMGIEGALKAATRDSGSREKASAGA